MKNLIGKVALVTGAQQGMGKADALALASRGAMVAVTDLNEGKCQTVVDEIISNGGKAIAFAMDVSKRDQVEAGVARTVQEFGRLDILVNNAGIFRPKSFMEITEEDWDATININLKGQFLCAQLAAKEMAKNKWGRIINISSVASGQTGVGIAGGAHYTASKGGVLGLTESLAIELAPLGITVNSIAPGAIDTPMIAGAGFSKEQLDGLVSTVPLKRMGTPEEIASAVVFLASEDSNYMTGSTMYVDGGWLAS
ncbi:MAG: SDR family NAD(P)-dependent oxidoreductase [bacterium]|nr:SDR family NAD(P)-dependent oxidoreductase [bacterium]